MPDGKILGGDIYLNSNGLLPKAIDRIWYEADVNYNGTKSRGGERLLYSNDGLLYFTRDHYNTIEPMGRWK
ncbi:ribonuclease domain-containing protein [Testudinibacter sp. P80/BLE/0925]|uniref:ribonuclease domain-containing protein n=1 Tax=Testudinibacter sp. TW-1 TaxID=3417757 RepID=UPI003D35CF92